MVLSPSPDRIGRLDFQVRAATLDLAMSVRPRLEDIAWRLAPRAIEEVLGRLDLGDMHLRLDRLDIDLGVVRPDHLEEDVMAAFTSALAEAIGEAVHDARQGPTGKARLVAASAAQLDHFERYLVQGVTSWSGRTAAFDPGETLIALAQSDAQGLATMLRRRAHRAHVIERLVLQAGDEALQALLRALAPADAAVILALLADVILAHRLPEVRAVVRIAEPALKRLFWVVVLEFLLRDPGTQFNRRVFLSRLLDREARETGVSYEALVRLLEQAVRQAQAHTGFRSSLPVVLVELLAGIRPADEIEQVRRLRPPDDEEPFALARAGDFEPLLALLRQRIDEDAALERLVRRLSPKLFEGVIERIEPANADRIMAVLEGLTAVQEAEPVSPLAPDRFETLLRVLTLRYFLRDAGTGYNRRRFLAYLLRHEAARAKIDYPELVRLLAQALERVSRRRSLAASLPADLSELLDELAPLIEPAPVFEGLREDDGPRAQSGEDDVARLFDNLRPHLGDEPRLSALLALVAPPAFEELIRRAAPAAATALLEALAAIRSLGPAGLPGGLSSTELEPRIRVLALRAALARRGSSYSSEDWTQHLLDALAVGSDAPLEKRAPNEPRASADASRAGARLATDIDEANLAAVAEDLDAFAALYAASDLPALRAERMETLLWSLAVAYLRDHKGARFARQAFVRRMLDGVANDVGVEVALVADQMLAGAEGAQASGVRLPPELFAALEAAASGPARQDDGRARLEGFLSTGRPESAGEELPVLARQDRGWLVSTIRRLVRQDRASAPRLLERLLSWLAPEELLSLMAPPGAARALIAVDDLAAGQTAAWLPLFEVLVRGGARDLPSAPAGADVRAARLAVIAHWLDSDGPPTWSPGPAAPAWLAQAAAGLSPAELERLFPSAEPTLAARRRSRLPALFLPPLASRLAAVPADRPQASDAQRERLLAWLDGAHAPAAEAQTLARRFAALAADDDGVLRAFLRDRVGDARARARWARLLPADAFDRLVGQLLPAHGRPALQSMRLLEAAWRRTAAFGGARVDPLALRTLLLEAMAAPGRASLTQIVQALASGVARLAGADDDGHALRREVRKLARQSGQLAASAALERALPPQAAKSQPAEPPPPPQRRPEPSPKDRAEDELPSEPDHALYVGNAGLVLLNPYLPALFERLGVLSTEEGKVRIRGIEATSRAVHLLQYMVDERLDRPEAELALNKLICGLPTAQPIEPSIVPRPEDLEVCDGLLKAMIANWSMIKNTSVAGLRETFLQREGRLIHDTDRWNLTVQRKTLDVLVDRVPWSFAVIYHRWMADPIHVTW